MAGDSLAKPIGHTCGLPFLKPSKISAGLQGIHDLRVVIGDAEEEEE